VTGHPIQHVDLPTYVTVGDVIDSLAEFDRALSFTILTPCGTRQANALDVVPADFGHMVQIS